MKRASEQTDFSRHYGAVWCAIPIDRYVTARTIAEEIGINPTTVHHTIADMREQGLPIVSSFSHGFKKARNDAEILDCISQIQNRISKMQDTVLALKKMLREEVSE